ncbi:hydrolase [Pestalotiopsis sp. NC0098]|nr:hydrolase [Pestalotiopsis sp. NC0098]
MPRIAIENALVFDGLQLSGPRTIIIDGSKISHDSVTTGDDTVIDGTGCTLLPGLFDCHVHVDTPEQLASFAGYGITTVCDMACFPIEKYNQLRSAGGPTTWLGASLPAFAQNSTHGKLLKFAGVGAEQAVHSDEDAVRFVADRVRDDVDYIKIIADLPGIEQEYLDKIQAEARSKGKMTVAHTAQYEAFVRGLHAGFDILTHSPMDKPLDKQLIDKMVSQGTVAVPTLTMSENISNSWVMWCIRGKQEFQNALDSVAAMHRAGVPILAGTDANNTPVLAVPAGRTLHYELELLVRAGLSPLETLRAATSGPAKYFCLDDRGQVQPGLRADLVLVEGNPTEDIAATRKIRRVWSEGEEVPLAAATESTSCIVM